MRTKCLLVCYTHFQFTYTSAHPLMEFLSFNYGSPKIEVYNKIIHCKPQRICPHVAAGFPHHLLGPSES